ncbi:hypothetical protein DdX_03576 [Ditylenchus destructor]|uniref:Uncharacterized protein n=1 Tax=Ditylenchus destructor TaxID=166010 RepID=A0AAD4NAL1_9BILA|nr:hypothetical protein DdX_03576 [Ditylenchus destructor]
MKGENPVEYRSRTSHALGIVTLLDENFIYVWGATTRWKELRYPRNAAPDIQVGTVVRYTQTKDFDEVQDSQDLFRAMNPPFSVVKMPHSPLQFKVQTLIVFPPEDYMPYSKVGIEDMQSVAIAFSVDFNRVACFIPRDCTPNTVFSGYVCRIPRKNNYLIPLVETLFCLTKDKLEEVTDPEKICDVFDLLPWNNTSSETENVMGEENCLKQQNYNAYGLEVDEKQTKPGYTKDQRNQGFKNEERFSRAPDIQPSHSKMDSKHSQPSHREPIVQPTNSNAEHDSSSDHSYEPIGIVVRIEPNYTVVWSRNDGLICANVEPGSYPLGKWVRYQCFEESYEPIECGNIRKSAFSLEIIPDPGIPPRRCYKVGTRVQVTAYVKRSVYRADNEAFISAHDDVLGTILCSKDKYLRQKLDLGVELFAIYMEGYQRASHWIAVAMKNASGDWTQPTNLPEPARLLARKAFGETDSSDEEEDKDRVKQYKDRNYGDKKFEPPKDWKGIRSVTDRKTEDVLGIVIKHEQNEHVEGQELSVLYTVFGLARLQKRHAIGTWLRTTILEDQEEDKNNREIAVTKNFTKCFIVLKSVVILPPMSTRVIRHNGHDRILLCGTIFKGGRCFENAYVGIVNDPHRVMPSTMQVSEEYLVEIGLVEHRGLLLWQVMKSHGLAYKDINWVPLERSHIPDIPGRFGEYPKNLCLLEESPEKIDPVSPEISTGMNPTASLDESSVSGVNHSKPEFDHQDYHERVMSPHNENGCTLGGFADTMLGAHARQGLLSKRVAPPRWNEKTQHMYSSCESLITMRNGLTGFEDTIAIGNSLNEGPPPQPVNLMDMNLEELEKGTSAESP